ncbi:Nn.00g054100.m01.CDS01 [Neocucurbitaria sp. VM-36]
MDRKVQDDSASTTSSQVPLVPPPDSSSSSAPKPSVLSRLNPFRKNESPEEKEARLREEKRKKELIEKYGYPSEAQLAEYNCVGVKGGKSGATVLGAYAAAGAAGGGGGGA